jgi:hypothetical protein
MNPNGDSHRHAWCHGSSPRCLPSLTSSRRSAICFRPPQVSTIGNSYPACDWYEGEERVFASSTMICRGPDHPLTLSVPEITAGESLPCTVQGFLRVFSLNGVASYSAVR